MGDSLSYIENFLITINYGCIVVTMKTVIERTVKQMYKKVVEVK